ncbi:MAG TPA: serine/threonine-protein kinase [Thermosynechococcaceae cyanobacterium]
MAWQVPGQTLDKGRYTVERELGRGRFAVTYLVRRSDGERWVIKILNPDVLAALSQEERDRLETMFWQEAVKLAMCGGTHIVKMKHPFKEGTMTCLPMEYLDGNSLADRGQRILSEAKALEYIQQIGEALTIVHSQDLVHRDVRPANIFLRIREDKAEAVLADFGLALDCDTELTRTRKTELMDGFSPIELYGRGRKVGPYTDVYSLAATLYELLTGKVPVSAGDRRIALDNKPPRRDPLESPQVKNSEISGKTTKAILAGMELEAANRPQSVQDWLKMLEQQTLPPPPKPEKDWVKWQAIGTFLGAGIAFLGVVATLFVGLPGLLSWLKSESQPTPQTTPTAKTTPK